MIPNFNDDGNLPEGIHKANWNEFSDRYGTNFYRKKQLQGLKEALENLKDVGCKKVYIDGSFVTSKNRPNDFDGCWDPKEVDPKLLDPVLLDFKNNRKAQKTKYCGELFLSDTITTDTGDTFLSFFSTRPRKQLQKRNNCF